MPAWPGPVLVIGGAILAVIGLGLAVGRMAVQDELLPADLPLVLIPAIGGVATFTAGLLYAAVRQLRLRRFLPPERYRGPSILILLALVLIASLLSTVPFMDDAMALFEGGELSLPGSIAIIISTQVAMLLVTWLLVFRPGALAALSSFGPEPLRALRAGIGWGVLAWIGGTLLSLVVVFVLEQMGAAPEQQPAQQAVARIEPWLVVLGVVILAPVAEEVFFRGVVFNAWLRERGRRWAFVGSSLLFAVLHVSVIEGAPVVVIVALLVSLVPFFLLGLALAWIYARTASLLAPIAMHAMFNGITVTILLLDRFGVITLPV